MSKENFITKTNDGYVVELFAKTKNNIEDEALNIAEGLTILETKKNKTEEEQFSTYKEILEKMEDRPVLIKVSDKGKDIDNLKCQFRALLKASIYGDLSIAIPKISLTEELIEIKEILEECKAELDAQNVQYRKRVKIGVVVEIPSSALISYQLAKECDFFFIDMDSLTTYLFGGKHDASEILKFEPTTIKLVRQAIAGAHDAGIFCGMCGEIVENNLYLPLLLGLGIDEFSMDAENIQKARETISKLDRYDCKELAKEILELRSLENIENKLKQFVR